MTTDALDNLMLQREVATKCRVGEAAVRKWISTGVKASDGRRVKLNRTRIAGRVFVSPADLNAFLTALNA